MSPKKQSMEETEAGINLSTLPLPFLYFYSTPQNSTGGSLWDLYGSGLRMSLWTHRWYPIHSRPPPPLVLQLIHQENDDESSDSQDDLVFCLDDLSYSSHCSLVFPEAVQLFCCGLLTTKELYFTSLLYCKPKGMFGKSSSFTMGPRWCPRSCFCALRLLANPESILLRGKSDVVAIASVPVLQLADPGPIPSLGGILV